MLYDSNLVFIHFPKNGGTFVREVFRQIYNMKEPNGRKNRIYNKLFGRSGEFGEIISMKHNGCNFIPKKHSKKIIFSTIRDPFQRYASMYYFGWWKNRVEDFGVPERFVKEKYPSFPDISFSQFLRLVCEEFRQTHNNFVISPSFYEENGWYSRRLVTTYFREPDKFSSRHNHDSWYSPPEKEMYDVTFLHTENLNDELKNFLLRNGYSRDDLEFISEKEKTKPSYAKSRNYECDISDIFSSKDIDYVIEKEKLFFSIFDEYKLSNKLGVSCRGKAL